MVSRCNVCRARTPGMRNGATDVSCCNDVNLNNILRARTATSSARTDVRRARITPSLETSIPLRQLTVTTTNAPPVREHLAGRFAFQRDRATRVCGHSGQPRLFRLSSWVARDSIVSRLPEANAAFTALITSVWLMG